jgi:hypothetical protein
MDRKYFIKLDIDRVPDALYVGVFFVRIGAYGLKYPKNINFSS